MNKILLILFVIFMGCSPNKKVNNTAKKAIYKDHNQKKL